MLCCGACESLIIDVMVVVGLGEDAVVDNNCNNSRRGDIKTFHNIFKTKSIPPEVSADSVVMCV